MKVESTKALGRRTGGFRIPISSIHVEVGMQNLVGSDISRGFPSMRTIHKCQGGSKTPISKPNWCDSCGRIVEKDETLKGYEVSKNEFVYLTNEEVEEAKGRFESKTMKVIAVTNIENLRPQHVLESYILTPTAADSKGKKSKDTAQNEKFYALLADKLAKDSLFIVGKIFTVRGELFVALTGSNDFGNPMLVMYSLYYPDEMKNPTSAGYVVPNITSKEQELMSKLVDREKKDLDFSTVSSELREIFDKKVQSRSVGEEPSEDGKEPVKDDDPSGDAMSELEKALSSS